MLTPVSLINSQFSVFCRADSGESFYTYQDLFVGAVLHINGRAFELQVQAQLATVPES